MKKETQVKIDIVKAYLNQHQDQVIKSAQIAELLGMSQQGAWDFMNRHFKGILEPRGTGLIRARRKVSEEIRQLISEYHLHTEETAEEVAKRIKRGKSTVEKVRHALEGENRKSGFPRGRRSKPNQ